MNSLGKQEFVARLGGVFEHSPWIAEQAWQRRPFRSVDALHATMMELITRETRDQQIALVRAHPELAGSEAREATLTADSSSEQGRLGFKALSKKELEKIAGINRRYREKFGFACIVALRLHRDRDGVMAEIERRLANDAATELGNALEQIGHITRGRLARLFGEK